MQLRIDDEFIVLDNSRASKCMSYAKLDSVFCFKCRQEICYVKEKSEKLKDAKITKNVQMIRCTKQSPKVSEKARNAS